MTKSLHVGVKVRDFIGFNKIILFRVTQKECL